MEPLAPQSDVLTTRPMRPANDADYGAIKDKFCAELKVGFAPSVISSGTCLVEVFFGDARCPLFAKFGRSQRIANVAALDDEPFDGLHCFR